MVTALLVSVNYSDCLEATLPYNTHQFDRIIVLTVESDKTCQDVCSRYSNVMCLVYPDHILRRKNKQFNKGAILNRGFDYLEETNYSDWLVLTDSDIIFPENFRDLLCNKEKKQGVLYGMKRKFVYTKDILQQYMSTKNQQLLEVFKEQSWIGFCQAFTYEPGKFKCSDDYNADKLDIIFRNENFDEYRQISDNREDILIHLGPHAKNWRGRVTTQFV